MVSVQFVDYYRGRLLPFYEGRVTAYTIRDYFEGTGFLLPYANGSVELNMQGKVAPLAHGRCTCSHT